MKIRFRSILIGLCIITASAFSISAQPIPSPDLHDSIDEILERTDSMKHLIESQTERLTTLQLQIDGLKSTIDAIGKKTKAVK